MEDLMVFGNEKLKFDQVRCIMQDDQPWFVAGDIYRYFGLKNPRMTLSKLDPDEKGVSKVYTHGGYQSMTTVNESGLYHLLFLINPKRARGKGSITETDVAERLEKVRSFRKWVTAEVLPSIRKTGLYAAEDLLNNPDLMIQILTAYKNEKAKVSTVAAVEPETPKYDNRLYGIREAAGILGITQSQLSNWLFDNGYTERDENKKLVPTIEASDRGILKLYVYRPYFSKNTETRTTKITASGLAMITKKLNALGKNKASLRKGWKQMKAS